MNDYGVVNEMKESDVVKQVVKWFNQAPNVTSAGKAGHESKGRVPAPDVVVVFNSGKIGWIECKRNDLERRTYLQGFGQAISYLIHADFSYYALPKEEMEKYSKYFWVKNIGLISISQNEVKIIRKSLQSQVCKEKNNKINEYFLNFPRTHD